MSYNEKLDFKNKKIKDLKKDIKKMENQCSKK